MNKRFYIIGNFGHVSKSIDGQTIKTRHLKELFESAGVTDYYDTDKARHFPLSMIAMFFEIPAYSSVIITVNVNGLKYIMPAVFFWTKLFRKKLYFVAIGGWLADFVTKHKLIDSMLKKFDKVFVESKTIINNLEKCGYRNVRYLFNFKTYHFERHDFLPDNDGKMLKMIFLSRVMWEKGIDIVEGIAETIDRGLYPLRLDIYGPIQEADKDAILGMINKYACLSYCGILPPEDVHKTMSAYDVLLFPTHWEGECFPGVILDAFIAGIPVIASNWKYNAELVTSDVGFLFDFAHEQMIIDSAMKLYNDRDLLYTLKTSAYNKRQEYSFDRAKEILTLEGVI